MMKRSAYFDHNATTPIRPEVREGMEPYLREQYGNPSSVYAFGQQARKAVDEAREAVASLIGAGDPYEVLFTSSGTEADNLAIQGVAFANRSRGQHIVVSAVEHHAVLNTCRYLEEHHGFRLTIVPVDGTGRVDPQRVAQSLTRETILVSIMHANNEVGTIQPIAEIGALCRARGVLFHTDAVQTLGKLPIRVDSLNVDLLSMSAHKIYGPKGVGALYIRQGTRLHALLHGGAHERNRRAGTENVAGIVGFGVACQLAAQELGVGVGLEREEQPRLAGLRDQLQRGLMERIPCLRVNGHPTERIANTLNVCIEYVEGEALILGLDLEGVIVSTGSACTSGLLEPSHVLMAMGIPPQVAQGSLRFSLGRDNTEKDVAYALDVVPRVVERLRAISPVWADYQKGRSVPLRPRAANA